MYVCRWVVRLGCVGLVLQVCARFLALTVVLEIP